ncbi:uncharacterized protein LOC119431184 isoform X4 [Dermacentor silvarum]|uniref:uncharacterized protein LOC119431184 isoform X4 n=1 Tax=Dermacentor silvarum TaxID=543639 RepID=UPI0021015F82|nr:uncharacterized protein LOC119431184 isoform X4 [Dermacentor silvarum]
MPHHGRPALHRVCDTVSGVNWRPTRFADELMLARHACCVCHVIPSTTVLLPCFHALCEQCQAGIVVEEGGSACPLDGELFCEDELQKLQLPDRKKPNLKRLVRAGKEYAGGALRQDEGSTTLPFSLHPLPL